MTTNDKIRNEKFQYDINRAAAKISALLLRNIDWYKYLKDSKILLPRQDEIIQEIKFT